MLLSLLASPVSCATFDCASLVNATACCLVRYMVADGLGPCLGSKLPQPGGAGLDSWRKLWPPRALVIGNNDYVGLQRLRKCANDACDLASLLFDKGHEVDLVLNGCTDAMVRAAATFSGSVTPANLATVCFSGHGMQAGSDNFMVAVDGGWLSVNDLVSRLRLGVTGVLDVCMFLDACREVDQTMDNNSVRDGARFVVWRVGGFGPG